MSENKKVADSPELVAAHAEGARWYKHFSDANPYHEVVYQNEGGMMFNWSYIHRNQAAVYMPCPESSPAPDWQELVLPEPKTEKQKISQIAEILERFDGGEMDEDVAIEKIRFIVEN